MISSRLLHLLLAAGLLLAGATPSTANQAQMYQLDDNQLLAAAISQKHQQRHQNTPGHYEFEVAPQMEPPSVRKPPYVQTATVCAGSDPFAGFSPRDTLCGDLNQGRVPLNPLGQSVGEQSYPFEIIKNKTLQFLARALPVLKLEYETIPKVARYLPANSYQHLLNPTHSSSSLTQDDMELVNQQLHGYSALSSSMRRRRRRRRDTQDSWNISRQANETTGGQASLNGVITKDGYKPIGAGQSSRSAQRQPGYVHAWHPGSIMQASGSLSVQPASRSAASEETNNKLKQQSASQVHPAQPQPEPQVSHKQNSPGDGNNAGSSDKQNGSASSTTDRLQTPAHHSKPQQVANGTIAPGAHAIEPNSAPAARQLAKVQPVEARRRLGCADSASGFTSAICQAASALIEPGSAATPAWLSLIRQLGGAAESGPSVVAPQSSIWSLLGSLVQDQSSAKSSPSSPSRGLEMLSLLGRLLVGGPPTRADTGPSVGAAERTPNSSEDVQSKQQTSLKESSQMQSLLGGSTMAKLALAGWASGAVTGLLDYLMPGVFSGASSRTFAKRKKPFDPQETFVDTPASLAANAAASSALRQPASLAKQPPTPCPSVEEYISPTFARNYQGAWKYVVQIPHEGYFTQTIQRTSCARQRCEFTEGICHESPRWVSLLVAEIYYPNTVFGSTGSAGGQGAQAPTNELVAAAPSTASIQRARRPSGVPDPLQMTDSSSLNNYNQNLYSLNQLGAELSSGWEPQSSLAPYNYQLMQRQGQIAGSRPSIESRSSTNLPSVPGNQPQQVSYSNEYIAALAAAALQQNPNLNVNDLLTSLQMYYQPGLVRHRRDLGAHQRRSQPMVGLPASAGVESTLVANELGQQSSSTVQQQAGSYKHTVAGDQHQPADAPSVAAVVPSQPGEPAGAQQPAGQECDGHDKIGCYVVRVYYDWFLVNGSCKCWKTGLANTNGSPQSSNGGNSFLRRIFTG